MRTRKFRTENPFSESKATKHLEWLFFFGCGSKYLGWDFGQWEMLEDGTQKWTKFPGPRVWSVPEDRIERIRLNPVWFTLKAALGGYAEVMVNGSCLLWPSIWTGMMVKSKPKIIIKPCWRRVDC